MFQFNARKRGNSRTAKRFSRRRRSTKCAGKKVITCYKTRGCKYAKGKKRAFCRKTRNRRRRQRWWYFGRSGSPFWNFCPAKIYTK